MTKIARSGSISQRHGSADPDPDPPQNVMDPQHWLQVAKKHFFCTKRVFFSASNFFLRFWRGQNREEEKDSKWENMDVKKRHGKVKKK